MLNVPLLARLQAATIILGSLALGNAHAEAWAVTDSMHPLVIPAGVQVRVILLDDQERLENQLSRNLPQSPAGHNRCSTNDEERRGHPPNRGVGQSAAGAD